MTTPTTPVSTYRPSVPDSAANGGVHSDQTTHATKRRPSRRISTETKASWKTTEFYMYILTVAGVLIASMTVGNDNSVGKNGASVGDYFRADKAWILITALTIGYMLARGIAKAGSRDFYDDDSDSD